MDKRYRTSDNYYLFHSEFRPNLPEEIVLLRPQRYFPQINTIQIIIIFLQWGMASEPRPHVNVSAHQVIS